MAGPKELPQLISEFIQMAKDYLRQETIEPGKKLGRAAGFGMAGAFLFAIAVLPLAVAGMRLVIEVLPSDPDHRMWSGLGYILSGLGLFGIAGIVGAVASR